MKYQYNLSLALLSFLFFIIVVVIYRNKYLITKRVLNTGGKNTYKKKDYLFLFFTILIPSVYAFAEPDTYHYHEMFDDLISYGSEETHFEDLYLWILNIIPDNYYFWRFSVWGIATLCVVGGCKVLGISPYSMGLFFPILYLNAFVRSRETLGIALLIYGIILFSNSKTEKSNIFLYFLAIICCVLSIFCHRFFLFYFILYIIFVFVPINKRIFIVLLLLFPVLYSMVLPILFRFTGLDISGAFQNAIIEYFEADPLKANIKGQIMEICGRVIFFMVLYPILDFYAFQKQGKKIYQYLSKSSFLLFYLACLFYGQQTSSWISSRTQTMGILPLLFCASNFVIERSNKSRSFTLGIYCSALFSAFHYIYYLIHW